MFCIGFCSLHYSKEEYIPKEMFLPGEEIVASQQYNGFESTFIKITTRRGKKKKKANTETFPRLKKEIEKEITVAKLQK